MTSVSLGKVCSVGSVGRAGGPTGGGSTQQALGAIAADVAARITAELDLIDPDGRRKPAANAQDPYGIDEIAAGLSRELNATPPEAGEIARALHRFATEIAARMGAVPDSRSLEQIGALLAGRATDVTDARSAIALIERATADLAA